MASRSYPAGVLEALYLLSQGFCYQPRCGVPVLKYETVRQPRKNVETAHIYAFKDGGPRAQQTTPVEDRNSFKNLILLCSGHHKDVDDKDNATHFPPDELMRWKRDREDSFPNKLDGLSVSSADDLETHLLAAISDFRNEAMSALDHLTGVSEETRDLLKQLIGERIDQPPIDTDAAFSLEMAATNLANIADYTAVLEEASDRLQGHHDVAVQILKVTAGLGNINSQAETISGKLSKATDDLHRASARLEKATGESQDYL